MTLLHSGHARHNGQTYSGAARGGATGVGARVEGNTEGVTVEVDSVTIDGGESETGEVVGRYNIVSVRLKLSGGIVCCMGTKGRKLCSGSIALISCLIFSDSDDSDKGEVVIANSTSA